LACLYAAAAENALIRVIAIKRVSVVYLIRFGPKGNLLVFDGQRFGCVVNSAIAVIVITDGAIEKVITENTVEGFALCCVGGGRPGIDADWGGNSGCTGPHEVAVYFNHTGVACLDGSELRVITDLGNLAARSIDNVYQPLTGLGSLDQTVNCDINHEPASSVCSLVEKMNASVMIFSEPVSRPGRKQPHRTQ
jgi:hypothetical protein